MLWPQDGRGSASAWGQRVHIMVHMQGHHILASLHVDAGSQDINMNILHYIYIYIWLFRRRPRLVGGAWRRLWPDDLFCFFSGKSSSSAFLLSRRLQFLGRSCRTLRSTMAPPCDLADDGCAWATCWTAAKVWVLALCQLLCSTKWPLSRPEPISKPPSVRWQEKASLTVTAWGAVVQQIPADFAGKWSLQMLSF